MSYRSNVLWNFVQIIGISNFKKKGTWKYGVVSPTWADIEQQKQGQLYVAQHIIACYRCCYYITGRTQNPQESNQKDVISLEFASYNPSAILL